MLANSTSNHLQKTSGGFLTTTTTEGYREPTASLSDSSSRIPYPSHVNDNEFLIAARTKEPYAPRFSRPRAASKWRLSVTGWRTGALISFVGALSVSILNLVITVHVWKHSTNGSIGTLIEGNCGTVKKFNVWIHLLVNALSTLLLCASNYCMQVLSAPNRQELDRVHAQRIWLQIGVPSLGNLKYIGRDRKTLWIVLFLSSTPLHLLFNSVVFTELQANKYDVIPATESWLGGGLYDTSNFKDFYSHRDLQSEMDAYRLNFSDVVVLRDNSTMAKYKNISTSDCFSKYSSHYVSEVGNVYLVQDSSAVWYNSSTWYLTRNNNTGNFKWVPGNESMDQGYVNEISSFTLPPFKSSPYDYPSNKWRCRSHGAFCNVENHFEVPQNRSLWAPYQSRVKYCVVEQVEQLCKLQFSFPIAAAVVVSNFIKAVSILMTLLMCRRHAALATIGDAVASFLDHPDPETMNRCLYSRQDMETKWEANRKHDRRERPRYVNPKRYKPRAEAWASASTMDRWTWTYTGQVLIGQNIVCLLS